MKTLFKTLISATSIILLMACNDGPNGVLPEKTTITESVYSSAIVEPDSFYKVYAAARGIVEEVLVEEGDQVQKGDLLLRIINDNSKIQSKNAQLDVDLAQLNYQGKSNLIQELKNELHLATLSLKNDSINFVRQQRLWQQEIGSQSDLEQRQLAFQAAQNKVNQLKTQLARKEDELKIALQRSQNNHANRIILQADFDVRSRINGKVYELLKEAGESVSEQEPIAYLGSSNHFILKMQVDEVDIVRVKTGQLIYLTLDAYANQVFEARVKQIIPKMNQETQTFWVEGTFENPPEVLYSGLRGEANIVLAKKSEALSIPLDYLLNGNQVITETETLNVIVGLKSLERAEILEGLNSNTLILKPE
ncbi:MAG: efflux RND transporter periplasmic adaptor subunit [Vicingaceae bacterium]